MCQNIGLIPQSYVNSNKITRNQADIHFSKTIVADETNRTKIIEIADVKNWNAPRNYSI